MAREIDLEKKLSDADRKYLSDRDRWRDLLDNYNRFGGTKPNLPKDLPQTGPDATRDALGPGALTPEEERQRLLEAQGLANGGDDGSGDEVDYNDMTVPELHEELSGRAASDDLTDEQRANLAFTKTDKKADLVARLDRDDELEAAKG